MNSEKKVIGSLGTWLAFRLMQGLATLFVLGLVLAVGQVAPRVALLVVAFVFLWSVAFAHHLGHAEADDQGLTFRRYFRQHFVPWSAVQSVRFGWYYPMIVITLRYWIGMSKWIHLWPPAQRSESLSGQIVHALGLSTPEAVSWMKEKLVDRS